MRQIPKATTVRTKPAAKAPVPMDSVLEACGELSSFIGGLPALRQRIAESTRNIFQAVVSGIMVREGESYHSAAVCPGGDDSINAKALMEHARSYAAQA